MNMERVKLQNRALITGYINDNGPVSRKDIAIATGLTAASVTQITAALIDEGILKELGTSPEVTKGAGRKKVLVDIDHSFAYVLALNIESDTTTAALCDIKGRPVKSGGKQLLESFPTDRSLSPEDLLVNAANVCRKLTDSASAAVRKRISCVSVCLTGIVDTKNGISVHAYGIWSEPVDVRSILTRELGLPVMLENNVDAFGIAELFFGIGRTNDNVLMIKWGPGVGSTIIIDDRIYKGRLGKTAEMGHIIIEKNGKLCSCGRKGCLETIVSYRALNEIIKFLPTGFEEAYLSADKEAQAKINDIIDTFARSIVNTGTILAPRRIVLFGKLFAGKEIRDKLIECCKNYDPSYDEKRIIHTSLSDKESYLGPAAVFVQSKLMG